MKKITILLTVLTIISCTEVKQKTAAEIAQENIEAYFLKTAHDPESYEFVSISKIDTVYAKEHYKEMLDKSESSLVKMKDYPEMIKKAKEQVVFFRKYGLKYETDALKSEKAAIKMEDLLDQVNDEITIFKNLYEKTSSDKIKELHTSFSCRANNKMGAKVLGDFYVILSDSLTVLSMDPK